MAKFIFKMENILSVKEKMENQAKAEYGMEIVKLQEEEEKKKMLENKQENYEEQLRQKLFSKLELQSIRRLESAIESIKELIIEQIKVIQKQEMVVAKAREKLDEAIKDRKTYEKLKEKAFEEFRLELNAKEQKEVDELVSFRHGNKLESEE